MSTEQGLRRRQPNFKLEDLLGLNNDEFRRLLNDENLTAVFIEGFTGNYFFLHKLRGTSNWREVVEALLECYEDSKRGAVQRAEYLSKVAKLPLPDFPHGGLIVEDVDFVDSSLPHFVNGPLSVRNSRFINRVNGNAGFLGCPSEVVGSLDLNGIAVQANGIRNLCFQVIIETDQPVSISNMSSDESSTHMMIKLNILRQSDRVPEININSVKLNSVKLSGQIEEAALARVDLGYLLVSGADFGGLTVEDSRFHERVLLCAPAKVHDLDLSGARTNNILIEESENVEMLTLPTCDLDGNETEFDKEVSPGFGDGMTISEYKSKG